jgi:hypothetical protein
MMFTYATFLAILLALEIAIVVMAYQYQDDFKDALQKGMQDSIPEYNNNSDIKDTWDTVQAHLKCCGVKNYHDWTEQGVQIPESCCKEQQSGCVPPNLLTLTETLAQLTIYTEGCVDKAFDDLKTEYGMYGSIALAGVELLGLIFGCCLGARFGRKRYSV